MLITTLKMIIVKVSTEKEEDFCVFPYQTAYEFHFKSLLKSETLLVEKQ